MRPMSSHDTAAANSKIRRERIERDINLLVEISTVEAELGAGLSPQTVAARSSLGTNGVAALITKNGVAHKRNKSLEWSPSEDLFLKASLGLLSDKDIGLAIGRSEYAVHIRWSRDLRLPAPSKSPLIMTANQIANGIGIDAKSVALLINRGILPGYLLAGKDVTRVVDRRVLLRFLVNPLNWVYFKPLRVGLTPSNKRGVSNYDTEFWSYARRLVLKKKGMWTDQWLRIGDAAELLGIGDRALNQAIRRGRVKNYLDWGNYWLKRSVVMEMLSTRSLFRPGKLHKDCPVQNVSDSAKAFILLARAVGLTFHEIDVLMRNKRRSEWVYTQLWHFGEVVPIIRKFRLKILVDLDIRDVVANWRLYKDRFPRLVKFMRLSTHKKQRSRTESRYLNNVKKKAKRFKELSKLPCLTDTTPN